MCFGVLLGLFGGFLLSEGFDIRYEHYYVAAIQRSG